eukprot:5558373-Prymnesium_polylepis.1
MHAADDLGHGPLRGGRRRGAACGAERAAAGGGGRRRADRRRVRPLASRAGVGHRGAAAEAGAAPQPARAER